MSVIILARAVHVLSGVIWAGFAIIVGLALVGVPAGETPHAARHARRSMVNRGLRIVAPAAILTLLSGAYLFSALHGGGGAPGEIALLLGAVSAVLALIVGAIGNGLPERRLAKLDETAARTRLSPEMSAEVAALDRRVVFSARVTAALLIMSGLAMGVARYL